MLKRLKSLRVSSVDYSNHAMQNITKLMRLRKIRLFNSICVFVDWYSGLHRKLSFSKLFKFSFVFYHLIFVSNAPLNNHDCGVLQSDTNVGEFLHKIISCFPKWYHKRLSTLNHMHKLIIVLRFTDYTTRNDAKAKKKMLILAYLSIDFPIKFMLSIMLTTSFHELMILYFL